MTEHKKFILTFIRHSVIHWHQQDLFFFSSAQSFQQCIANRCGTWRVNAKSECHHHRQGIHVRIIAVGQLDTFFSFKRIQNSTLVHGTNGGTERRGDYPEQLYQLHFIHPYITCIGWYGNSTIAVRCDYFPFHIPAIFTFPNDLLSLSPSIVRSLSNFCTVICRLGKQRLSALQR